MAKARWTWLMVAALVGAAGCKDDGDGTDPDDDTPAGVEPGFGKNRSAPKGTPFSFPAGVQVVSGTIKGANDDGDCSESQVAPVGSGLNVRGCLEVRNTTGAPVQVVFPPGLVIVSASETYQNGILVEREVVTIPPTSNGPGGVDGGAESETVSIPLHLYCINKSSDPSDSSARFELGPITDHPKMREIFTLMEGKDISNQRDPVEAVQEAVFSVSDGDGLTAEDREALKDL
ncbi:hypothetical protein [Pyxidicoccus trucidator]|uniref:hypothetical protein n=1 Tax=Pyxidicoccus trucidator TaxID=2709662 RepID=UPI0013DD7947|nr:hypothetical protein [Pyxidicoccus trucidator]